MTMETVIHFNASGEPSQTLKGVVQGYINLYVHKEILRRNLKVYSIIESLYQGHNPPSLESSSWNCFMAEIWEEIKTNSLT